MGAMARHRITITFPEEWMPAIMKRMKETGAMKVSEYIRQLMWRDIRRYRGTIYPRKPRRKFSPVVAAILRALLEKGSMEPYFIYKEVVRTPGLENTKHTTFFTALFRLRRRDGVIRKEGGKYMIADEEKARRIIEEITSRGGEEP